MRKVTCNIPPNRRKLIKLNLKEEETDVEFIKKFLLDLSKTDEGLSVMFINKILVLQKFDKEMNNWYDVENDDVLENGCEIKTLFLDIPVVELDIKCSNQIPMENVIVIPADNECNSIPPLKKMKVTNDASSLPGFAEEVDDDNSNQTELTQSNKGVEDQTDNVSLKSEVDDKSVSKVGSYKHKADLELKNLKANKASNSKNVNKVSVSLFNVLPALTPELELKLKNVVKCQKDFIRHWGSFLIQQTGGEVTKQQYSNYSTAIVSAYPQLAGGEHGTGIIRSALSSFVRNHKKANKKKQVILPSEKMNKKPATDLAIMGDDTRCDKVTDTDIERALVELNKFTSKGGKKNINHFKRLLEITQAGRRLYIENEALTISDVLEKFPFLISLELILHESFHILLNKTQSIIFDEIETMMNELNDYYNSTENNNLDESNNSEDLERNDRRDVDLIHKLCEDLTLKRYKNNTPLWDVQKVLTSKPFNFDKNVGPKAVILTDKEELHQAFIVLDMDNKIEVNPCKIKNIIAGLLGCYYTFHRDYPAAYANVFTFLTSKILKVPFKNNMVVYKFIRDLENFKTTE